MIDPLKILAARDAGLVRYGFLSTAEAMPSVLAKFGLKPDQTALREFDAQQAKAILKGLLWKDAAYSMECMTETQAELFAGNIIESHGGAGGRYYSNRDRASGGAWTPMTDATFDSGVIIARPDSIYVCIWFEDED